MQLLTIEGGVLSVTRFDTFSSESPLPTKVELIFIPVVEFDSFGVNFLDSVKTPDGFATADIVLLSHARGGDLISISQDQKWYPLWIDV